MSFNTNSDPATDGVAVDVSSSDDNMSGNPCKYFYVGTSGDVAFETMKGNTVTLANAAVGYHPWAVKEFKNSGTTASDIIACYID